MRKQSGQTAVEFALIAPMFFMMCFAMIYAGILFMDYLNYNNSARSIARAVSIENPATIDKEKYYEAYIKPLTNLYVIENINDDEDFYIGSPRDDKGVEIPATINTDIEVVINLKLNADLPKILSGEDGIGFPPEKLKPIKYTIKRENISDSSQEGEHL